MLPAQLLLKRKRAEPNGVLERRSRHKYERATEQKWRSSDVPELLKTGLEGFLDLEEMDGEDFDTDGKLSSLKRVATAGENKANHLKPTQNKETCSTSVNLAKHFDSKPPGKQRSTKGSIKQLNETNPIPMRSTVSNQFSGLNTNFDINLPAWQPLLLSDSTLQCIHDLGFAKPTRIQELAIPSILSGNDLIGKAATGSGKTLAFGIPIVESILATRDAVRSVAALILAPTRELAHQLTLHLEQVGRLAGIRLVTITGGLSIDKQLRQLRQAPDIVVATPGRLWDILSTKDGLLSQLSDIRFLVLDEADRILQAGHFQEVQRIIEKLGSPADRQTLVFSATFQKDLQLKLTNKRSNHNETEVMDNEQSLELLLEKLNFRRRPLFVDANPESQVAQAVQQCLIETSPLDKDFFLYYLLLRYPGKTLVFTNSISDVNRLVQLMNILGISAHGLHSSKQQKARMKSIERFTTDKTSVLVASDVASRGLDIPLVDTVIHYHLPRSADLYIHRSGRTARGHNRGLSILLCSPTETPALRKMQRTIRAEDMTTFSIEPDSVGAIRPRVNLARKLLQFENEKKGLTRSGDSWLAEAAADLGTDLSCDLESAKLRQLKDNLYTLKAQLQQELKRPICSGLNSRYPTRGGSILVERLLAGASHESFLGETTQKALDHSRRST